MTSKNKTSYLTGGKRGIFLQNMSGVRARFVINAPFCYETQKLPRFVITHAPFCYKPQELPRFVITLAPFCYKELPRFVITLAPFCNKKIIQ